MTPLESALAAWIAFHAELGVDIEAYLLPPATEAQIVEVEQQIGYRLPDDLRELYKIANGQWDMFDDDSALIKIEDDQRWAPLFGNYDFMPLNKALRQYEFYLDIYTSSKEFNTKYYQANPEETYSPIVWEVREGDAVDPAGWNPSWFTFAGSEANSYSVDMSPPHGGAPGQVVLHGADEFVLQVPGNSVTDLMEQAVVHLSLDEEHRFQFSERDGPYRPSVFFDMDWRGELYIPGEQQQEEPPAAYTQWLEERVTKNEAEREQLSVWLQGSDISVEQQAALVNWVSLELIDNQSIVPPASVLAELQLLMELQDLKPARSSIQISNVTEHGVLQGYAMNLAGAYMSGSQRAPAMGLTASVDDTIDMYHQFKLESGDWTQAEFNQVDDFFRKLLKLPLDLEDGFSMDATNSSLSICQSTFDEKTYKSDETCYEFDLK